VAELEVLVPEEPLVPTSVLTQHVGAPSAEREAVDVDPTLAR
jgi:hypothetical protein